jgi:hypothetical protein
MQNSSRGVPGCDAVQWCGRIPVFQRAMIPWRSRQLGPSKRWYPTTSLHSVTTRNTTTWTLYLNPLCVGLVISSFNIFQLKFCMHFSRLLALHIPPPHLFLLKIEVFRVVMPCSIMVGYQLSTGVHITSQITSTCISLSASRVEDVLHESYNNKMNMSCHVHTKNRWWDKL